MRIQFLLACLFPAIPVFANGQTAEAVSGEAVAQPGTITPDDPQAEPKEQPIVITGGKGEQAGTAKKALTEWLRKNLEKDKTGMGVPPAAVVENDQLAKLFPGATFVTMTIRQYPIARPVMAPLKDQNIFFVSDKGDIAHITDAAGLEKFFKMNLPAIKSDDDAKNAASAWERLTVEFSQDGMYTFNFGEAKVKAGEKGARTVTIAATVAPNTGNRGQINSTLEFDADGKLTGATDTRDLKPGIRPICQATKLLDADPVVRKMAQRDILIMGQACRDYLDEQRAKASPELKSAIDDIWQRILRDEQ